MWTARESMKAVAQSISFDDIARDLQPRVALSDNGLRGTLKNASRSGVRVRTGRSEILTAEGRPFTPMLPSASAARSDASSAYSKVRYATIRCLGTRFRSYAVQKTPIVRPIPDCSDRLAQSRLLSGVPLP
jgi:hypothetical protein